MKTRDFYYELPESLIAQTPIEPRDMSRMLVCNRENDRLSDRQFREFPDFLRQHDVLVINHTRVIPARLIGEKIPGGAACEVLLLQRLEKDLWEAMVRPGRRLKEDARIRFGDGRLIASIGKTLSEGLRQVHFEYEGVFEALLDELGQMPLPPYIHERLSDPERYQTVYAKLSGSAAAPTAGLHFTDAILDRVREKSVDIVPILLHVGLGTFRPVKEESIEDHPMHAEYYEVSEEAASRINAAREKGGRIVCVGTTSVRTLETLADEQGAIHPGRGETSIFIYPGVPMRATDVLLTNFHLPESTLLMLVSAFMGRERALKAYEHAVKEAYRFFSFGDCMLIGKGLV